jgi:hypothetical protein
MILLCRVERPLHCTLPPSFRSIQRFLRVVQLDLRLSQLQSGEGAFAFSLVLLPECFLCLSARLEELRAQTLDELEGVIEQIFPVVKRPRH